MHSLSLLHSDRSNLENLRCRPKDLAQVLGHLSQLNALAESTSGKVNREEEHVVRCRTHVQTTQRFIEQLQPWIEQAENYLSKRLDQNGALNLVEAKQLYEKHKVNFVQNTPFILIDCFLGFSRRTSSNVAYLQ